MPIRAFYPLPKSAAGLAVFLASASSQQAVARSPGHALLSPLAETCLLNVMAIETTITWEDGVRFRVNARGHEIVCDQPAENGGADEGMTPLELLLASLGTCAAYYAAEYLRARSLPAADLTAAVSAEKAQGPTRLTSFRVV